MQELRNRLDALVSGPCTTTTKAEADRIVKALIVVESTTRSATPTFDAERRVVTSKSEFRSGGKGIGTMWGYAVVYGAMSVELRDKQGNAFRERIMPGAFDAVLRNRPDVVCLRDHKPDLILGRTGAGTLRIGSDNYGLKYECDLPDTSAGRDVRELVERGDLRGCSFAFSVGEDDWDYEGGQMRRTIHSVDGLKDVSVVTNPAYEDTEVGLRCSVAVVEMRSRFVTKVPHTWRQDRIWRSSCESYGINPDTASTGQLVAAHERRTAEEGRVVIARRRQILDFLLS